MTPFLWIEIFVWDGLLAGLILGCFWWDEHYALKARQGKRALARANASKCGG